MASKLFLRVSSERLKNHINETSALLETKTVNKNSLRVPFDFLNKLIKDLRAALEKIDESDNLDDSSQTAAIIDLIYDGELLSSKLEASLQTNSSVSSNETNKSTVNSTAHLSTYIRPPKLTIKPFSGIHAEFHVFWQHFERHYHQNTSIHPIDKFTFLLMHLQGDAELLLKHLQPTEENYEAAVQLLKNRFGDKTLTIQSIYRTIKDIPPASYTLSSLKRTYDTIEANLRALENLGETTDGNTMLFDTLLGKYPEQLFLTDSIELTNTASLRSSIQSAILKRERISAASSSLPKAVQQTTTSALISNAVKTDDAMKKPSPVPAPKSCIFCQGAHWTSDCDKFCTYEERRAKIAGNCYICLYPGHSFKKCKRRFKACFHCKQKGHHHASLCPQKFKVNVTVPTLTGPTVTATTTTTPTTQIQDSKSTKINKSTTSTQALLCGQTTLLTATTTVRNLDANIPRSFRTRIILDSASDRTHATRRCSTTLNLIEQAPEKLAVNTFGAKTPQIIETPTVTFLLETRDGTTIRISALLTDSIIPQLDPPNINQFRNEHPEYADKKLADDGNLYDVDILIGLDYLIDILSWSKVNIDHNTVLLDSIFGWIIAYRHTEEQSAVMRCFLTTTKDPVQKLWALDSIGITEKPNEDEESAIESFYNSITLRDGRYHVSWPWKSFPPNLPTNYGLAFGRLQSVYKTLNRSAMLDEYDQILQNQIESGVLEFAEKTTEEVLHYLPHHPVFTPEKSTPLRIVQDASARQNKTQRSLNDCLLKGRTFLDDLAATILRFRTHEITLVADIEKAYLQIGLHKADRDAVRLLWIKNLREPPSKENSIELRHARVPFGIISSPFLLAATVRHHIQNNPSPYTDKLLSDFYADNLTTGVQTVDDGLNLYQNVKELFSQIGMNIRKWNSNSSDLITKIPPIDRENQSTTSLLGLQWHTSTDTISIKPSSLPDIKQLTKRSILQYTAAIYDPLGFFSPAILPAKILIQRLWEENYDWDTQIADTFQTEWIKIHTELERIRTFYLPRYIGTTDKTIQEIHCFVDASARAYASVLFLRIVDPENDKPPQIVLLFSKTRLAPPTKENSMSIPKLELLAAVLGSRNITFVEKSLNNLHISEKYLWSDSKCVISWVHSSRVLPKFIERRVCEIKNSNVIVRHVPGVLNMADVASRGGTLDELIKISWWNGPEFLQFSPDKWPQTHVPDKNDTADSTLEIVPTCEKSVNLLNASKITASPPPLDINIRNYSSLSRLYTATAKGIEACERWRKKQLVNRSTTQTYYAIAEQRWILFAQQDLTKKQLENLNTYTDENGIIRSRGRFENATQLTYDEKFPIVLPPHSYLTELIIMYFHIRLYHVGVQHTLGEIRKRFWIPRGRQTVYNVLRKHCWQCKKLRNKPYRAPPIPPLPSFRMDLNPTTPFANTGIDVLGPLFIKGSAETENSKRWILLCTCLITRAVHLEIIADMTTKEILAALRMFFARRGVPALILSDNAPQFHLFHNVYEINWENAIKDPECISYFAQQRIVWKWIPQLAPWFGGAYERMVQLVKHSLCTTFHRITLTDRQLQIAITEIESVINSRPLTYLGPTLEDVVTPSQFLHAHFTSIPPANTTTAQGPTAIEVQDVWKKADEHLNRFWEIFYTRYISAIRDRCASLKQQRITSDITPKIGTVVMVADDNVKRGYWKLAEIIELETSCDGEIRSAHLRMPNGNITRRPIIKLIPLELSIAQPQQNSTLLPAAPANSTTREDDDFSIAEVSCEEILELPTQSANTSPNLLQDDDQFSIAEVSVEEFSDDDRDDQ